MDGDHYAQFHIENMLKTSQPTRQAGTTISYNTTIENDRTYYQTQCDYPGCDSGYEGTEHEYWETPDLAAEDATNNGMWLTLTDWQGGKNCSSTPNASASTNADTRSTTTSTTPKSSKG